jgi:DNA-directed RNA polymerase specialized sigma24 family protein
MTRVAAKRDAATPTLAPLDSQQTDDLVSDLYQAHAAALVRLAKLLLHDQPSAEDVV